MAGGPTEALAQSLAHGLVLSVAKRKREVAKKQQEAADPHQAFIRLIRSRGLHEEKEGLSSIIKRLRAASGRSELTAEERDLVDRANVQFDAIYRQAIALSNTDRLTRLDSTYPNVFQRFLDGIKLVYLFGDGHDSLWHAVPFRVRSELDLSVLAPKGTPFIGADAQLGRRRTTRYLSSASARVKEERSSNVGSQWDSPDIERVTLELAKYFSLILNRQTRAVEGDAATVFVTSSMVPKLAGLYERISAAIQNMQSGATTSLRAEPVKEDFYKRLDQHLGEWLEILKGKTAQKVKDDATLMVRFCREDVKEKEKRRGGLDGNPFIDDATCVKIINESVRLSVCEWVRLTGSSIDAAASTTKALQRSAQGLLTDADPACWQLKRFGEELEVLKADVATYERKTSIPPINARAILDDACSRAIDADLSVYMKGLSDLVSEQILDDKLQDAGLLKVVDELCIQLKHTAAERANAGSLKNAFSLQCSKEIALLLDRAEAEGLKYQKWFESILVELRHKTKQLMTESSVSSSHHDSLDNADEVQIPVAMGEGEAKDDGDNNSTPPSLATTGLSADAVEVLNLYYTEPLDQETWRSICTSLVRLIARFSINADPCLAEGWSIHLAAVDQLTQQYQPDNERRATPTLKQLMAKFPSIACCMGLTRLIGGNNRGGAGSI